MPIFTRSTNAEVMEAASKIARDLGAHLDAREGQTPGAKFFHWELRGAPVVFELGPRYLASGKIVIKRRDTGAKEPIAQSDAASKLSSTLELMQKDLYARAKERLDRNTVVANSITEVEELLADVTPEKGGGKFVMAHAKDAPEVDAGMKEFKATVRGIPSVDHFDGPGKCIVTDEPVDRRVVIAKAY